MDTTTPPHDDAFAVVERGISGNATVTVEGCANGDDDAHVEIVATVDGREVAISLTTGQAAAVADDIEAVIAEITAGPE